jgi:hypothetical protein
VGWRGREERGATQGRLGKTWAARGRCPWHAGPASDGGDGWAEGAACALRARVRWGGAGGAARGSGLARALGQTAMMGQGRGSGCAGWAEGTLGCRVGCWAFFLFLSYFFIFCSFLFSPPFQIELLIKRTLHKITHSRK